MVTCCISSCKSKQCHYLTRNGLTFHRFPKDTYRKKRWLAACNLNESSLNPRSMICSIHFEEECFQISNFYRRLLHNWAVPTLYLNVHSQNTVVKGSRKRKFESETTESDTRLQNIENKKRIHNNGCDTKSKPETLSNEFENMLKTLKLKFNIKAEDLEWLREINVGMDGLADHLEGSGDVKPMLSPNMRSFLYTLFYLCPKAYYFFRKKINNCLPMTCKLKKMDYNDKGEPGFVKEAFIELKHRSNSTPFTILATLVIGEMSIRHCTELYDNKTEGFINIGTNLRGDHLPEVKEVLVFLLTAINNDFKIPVAYFLVDKINSSQRAELVKQCLIKVQLNGIKIVALSCKGSSSDIAMAEYLGCSLKGRIVKFEHPLSNSPVIILWDLYYMIKLLLNSLKCYKTIVDSNSNKIEWRYIDELDKINNENFKNKTYTPAPANNLGCLKYFEVDKIKSKLKFCPFTLTIINAIEYCRKDLKLKNFTYSQPTQQFLTVINNIVDVFTFKSMNSRSLIKAFENKQSIYHFIDQTSSYIANLKTDNNILLARSRYKTGSLGILGCLEALKLLIARLNPFKDNYTYIPLYKLSLKQLELFLYNIKTNCGSDYPTAREFKNAFKNILFGVLKKDSTENRLVSQDVSLLENISAVLRINKTTIYDEGNNCDLRKNRNISEIYAIITTFIFNVSEYKNEAFTYIVIYVTRKLLNSIVCDDCLEALTQKTHNIMYPSNDVVTICKITELRLKVFERKDVNLIIPKIMQQFIGTKIFDSIDYHQIGMFPTSNHVIDLIKAVVEEYMNIRLMLYK